MTKAISAGILIFKRDPQLKILLCHMGGPFWEGKDKGAWGIPKGLVDSGESLEDAAIRECVEETGFMPDSSKLINIGSIKMTSGKEVYAWAIEVESNFQAQLSSNTFEMEWPPKSGKIQSFPEIDQFEWFSLTDCQEKIIAAQYAFCERVAKL